MSPLDVLPARIISKICVREDGCWEWTGAISKPSVANPSAGGYGRVRTCVDGVAGHVGAHRFVYETVVGPIPEGMQLDHKCCDPVRCVGGNTCPHRRCCNPDHLEPVTGLENQRRAARYADACDEGHPFDEANTRVNPRDGRRICRKCDAARARDYRARQRVAV
jgi:hypothetical protein